MHVIVVTPLIRGSRIESLSYFSAVDYPVGTLLSVPIRGKTKTAIVTASRLVKNAKTNLKSASFSLRKLPQQPDAPTLPKSIRDTANELADQYPVTAGTILFNLLPPDIRSGSLPYPACITKVHDEETIPKLLTAQSSERYVLYQSIIRSTFAKKGSVLFIVPTNADIQTAVDRLKKGIDKRLVVFHSSQAKGSRGKAYQTLSDDEQTKLIITTPSHAFVDRADVATIIIDQSASGHYVKRQRPYLDYRNALIAYAKSAGRAIILGDTVPRTEDEVLRREDVYLSYIDEPVKRLAFPATLFVINQADKPKPDQPFQLFSNQLKKQVSRALESRGHVFFYAARRGLAPVVACIDCGHIFRCPDSNTPYSLLRTHKNVEEQRWFVSSTSGSRVRAADVCSKCGSWRLRERGIGIQSVYDEWQEQMPDVPTFVFDSETAKTPKQAKEIAEQFYNEPSAVLIGTQSALPYIARGVDLSAIISLDAARSIPTWRADESLFRLLFYFREHSRKEVIIQTRTEEDNLLLFAKQGALERFYDDEIALRKMLQYPPYQHFILLTWTGDGSAVAETETLVEKTLSEFSPQIYTNANSSPQKLFRHALLRIDRNDHKTYLAAIAKLRSLPPYVKVEIDPERIV